MTAVAATAGAVALAVFVLLGRRPTVAVRRMTALRGSPTGNTPAPAVPAAGPPAQLNRRWLRAAVGLAAVAAVVSLGPWLGLIFATVVAGVTGSVARRRLPQRSDPMTVALLLDLLAGCLSAGLELPSALDSCSWAVDHVVAQRCRSTAASLHTGDPPDLAFGGWIGDETLEPVGRLLRRTGASGAATAEELRRCAVRLRSRRRLDTLRRVQQVGVVVVLPLGLCFLPAFVLVAVVPLVLGFVPSV